jgi:hypothetical protein
MSLNSIIKVSGGLKKLDRKVGGIRYIFVTINMIVLNSLFLHVEVDSNPS